MECNNLLTASDLSVGTQITSGTYSGYYVRAVINLGGGFNGVEGGNRPAFNSGGKQGDMIRNIMGTFWGVIKLDNFSTTYPAPTGAFYPVSVRNDAANAAPYNGPDGVLGFDASRYVPTGSENAPINVSIRLLMRQS
jgi:hypothetical protein